MRQERLIPASPGSRIAAERASRASVEAYATVKGLGQLQPLCSTKVKSRLTSYRPTKSPNLRCSGTARRANREERKKSAREANDISLSGTRTTHGVDEATLVREVALRAVDDGAVNQNEVTGGAGRSDPLDLGSFPVHFGNVFRPWYSHDVRPSPRQLERVAGSIGSSCGCPERKTGSHSRPSRLRAQTTTPSPCSAQS